MTEGKIFISYRRSDASGFAGRLFDRLSAHFGEENIFMDVEGLDPGVDFVKSIENAVGTSDILIALIGKEWLNTKDEKGKRRLENPEDFVRIEIATALDRDIRIIPVLVQDARMPSVGDLPASLKRLARLNAFDIRHERFNADVDRLARGIEIYLKEVVDFQESELFDNAAQVQSVRSNTKPRELWYLGVAIGLILIIVLVVWSGGKILGLQRDTETPTQTVTKAVSIILTATNTPRPKTMTVQPTDSPQVLSFETPKPEPTLTTINSLPGFIKDQHSVPMALVPAGSFEMGNDADVALTECQKYRNDCERSWFEKEEPVHNVTLDDFYIDQYEVTNDQFAAFLNDRGNQVEGGVSWLDADDEYVHIHPFGKSWESDAMYADHPVIFVSWYGAKAYCQWRNARLPTETEWEKAARGGLEGALYPWGDDAPVCEKGAINGAKFYDHDACNIIGVFDIVTTEQVGSYGSNGYKLYDMAGNVWEWTQSIYQDYPYDATDGREDLEVSGCRVLRGGSWGFDGYNLRVASRGCHNPSFVGNVVGFRCARSP